MERCPPYLAIIDAVHGKYALGEIDSTVIMLMDFPFRGVDEMSEIPSWLLLPFAETSPQPRYGEVPFIRLTRF